MKVLIENGANCNVKDFRNWTLMHWMAKNGKHEVVDFMIQSGANLKLNLRNDKMYTPLHMAAQNGHHKVIQSLISGGAKVSPIG